MAESIESFVERLQKEGVEVGRAEAEKIASEARADADRTRAEARAEAEKIVAEARTEAERTLEQGRGELALAARDVFARLRETLTKAVAEVVRRGASAALADEAFLRTLLHDVIVQYAQKDAEGTWPIELRISESTGDQVIDGALKALTDEGRSGGDEVDLKGRLKSAGFEYSVSRGVVEVTPESVAAALEEMIGPRLRELIEKAAADDGS